MLVLLGCADSHGTRMQERTGHDAGDQDASAHDAGSDEPAPDASTECRNDDECDDGVECTRDTCSNHQCVSARDDDFCSDRRFCNGDEICDVVAGCRPGKPRTCDDRDACTIDSCDEKKQACVHAPRTGQEICDDGSPSSSTVRET
jgi:hypothetical protein